MPLLEIEICLVPGALVNWSASIGAGTFTFAFCLPEHHTIFPARNSPVCKPIPLWVNQHQLELLPRRSAAAAQTLPPERPGDSMLGGCPATRCGRHRGFFLKRWSPRMAEWGEEVVGNPYFFGPTNTWSVLQGGGCQRHGVSFTRGEVFLLGSRNVTHKSTMKQCKFNR